MKIEQLIVQYFYQNRQLTLPGIGTFTISPDVAIVQDGDKDVMLPPNALQFEYNRKAGYDEGLVDYIVEHTSKIRPLASSDIESYVSLNKQILNIGRPLILEGMGTLQKNQAGDYIFTQHNAYAGKKQEIAPVVIKEKVNTDISFEETKSGGSAKTAKSILLILVSIATLGALAAAAYYFYNNRKTNENNIVQVTTHDAASQKAPDTSHVSALNDTLKPSTPDSLKAPVTPSAGFSLFINKYPNLATAEKKLAKLKSYGHANMKIVTSDSVNYQIVLPFNLPLSDTLKVVDSIKKIFPGTYIIK